MSVRRPQRDCVLCLASLDEDAARAIFHAHQEEQTAVAACERLSKGKITVEPAQLRVHFQYHRPMQPAPRTRFKPEEALARVSGYSPRLRELVLLVSRAPGLSGTQLAELFYWTGEPAQLNSARAACYRDLSRLVRANVLYRWYPPMAKGPSGSVVRAWQHRLSFYALGRDGVPYVSQQDGYEPQRGRDWFASEEELPEPHEMFAAGAAAETIASLARQALRLEKAGTALDSSQGKIGLHFSAGNWFGSNRIGLPVKGTRSQPVFGLASFALHLLDKQTSVQAPFLYEYDDGLRPLPEAAAQILRFVELKRAGALGSRFPDLARAKVFPPLLVIASDIYRLEGLRRAVQAQAKRRGATTSLPIIVCADQASVTSVGLSPEPNSDPWVSIWDAAATPRRYRLADVLVHPWQQLGEAGFGSDHRLAFAAGAALPQLREQHAEPKDSLAGEADA